MDAPARGGARLRVLLLVAALAAGAGALVLTVPAAPPTDGPLLALPVLAGLVVLASLLVVRFRAGAQEDTITLVEAVLAVLLYAYAGPTAVAVAVVGAVLTAAVRRTPLLKSAFNTAQWGFAVALGSAVVATVGDGYAGLPAVGLGLLAAWAANNAAFTTVLVLATGRGLPAVLQGLAPVIVPGWLGGFGVNVALGLLFVLAFDASPAAVLLYPVPLLLLHAAHRGYALARADRTHLAGLHRAAQALSGPVDPQEAVPAFLQEVLSAFDASRAVLVLSGPAGTAVTSAVREGACTTLATTPLWDALAASPHPLRVEAGAGELGRLLADEGARSAVSAPLLEDGQPAGALVVLDRTGVQGLPSGELEVLVAIAREAASTLEKGRLLSRMLEDRRRLAEIVGSTSDGILTLDLAGTVTSWNPALEAITGLPPADVVGRPGALARLDLRTVDGRPVDLTRWASADAPPGELRLTTPLGPRRVVCTYDRARDDDGEPRTLVVVARDVTPVEDLERLRQDFHRLVQAEAAQRLVVEQLQQAVMPVRPAVPGAEVGVAYVASDPTSPTGGDLYDCQVLPDGDVHLCVVDVLGHGVEATQDALTVMHTLRTVVLDGTPVEQVVARADQLLGRQDPELVATVVLARYTPTTGRLLVASGGHPPALVVTAAGAVRQLAAQGGAIGWPGAGSEDPVEDLLQPGDSLLLYTDGLVEARKDIDEGLLELEGHARDVRSLPASDLADALVDRVLQGAARRDDTLALVLRRDPPGRDREKVTWTADPVPEQAAVLRRSATAWLAERDVETDDAALVLGELLANAVEHARTCVELELVLGPDGLVVQVHDDGPGFAALPAQRAADDAEEGRGLHIVRALATDLRTTSSTAGSVLRALLPVESRVRVE